MTGPQRFSPLVHLPKLGVAAALFLGLVPVVVVVGVLLSVSLLPARLTMNWYWPHYAALIASLVPVAYGSMLLVRHLHRLGVRATIREWLKLPRTPAERAAGAYFASWDGATRSKRGSAVSNYLAAVPPHDGRVLVVGPFGLPLTDDGTLNEEADALEGRAKKSPRWPLVLFTIPFSIQFLIVIATSGPNPLRWPSHAWMLVLPVGLNIVVGLMSFGIIRPPGSFVLASPRRVEHTRLGRSRTFTPDDSVIVITKVNRWIVCSLIRNDGKVAAINYPTLDTPGLVGLVSRWCMLIPGDHAAPIPPPVAVGVSAV